MKFITVLLTTLLVFTSCKKSFEEEYQHIYTNTDSIPNKHYVGSKACASCHKNEYKLWQGSHHDMAMQIANRKTIIAPFKGESFTSNGVTSTFYQTNGKFYVNTDGRDGKNHDYEILYAFGFTPLQQYIVKFPDGHYQCLRTAYDTKKNKWFDLYPDFKIIHEEWLHWSRGGENWNTMCSDCHSTNVKKNYDEKTHSYKTNYAIINVSCESCHGPGKNHVTAAKKEGKSYQYKNELKMVHLNSKELVDECGKCHARRENISLFHNHDGTFLDHYFPQLLTSPIYYPDGQILDEDYEYASFTQSKMYHKGVTCTNCHNPHSTKRKFEDNRLCTQCHQTKKYDSPKHHKHPMNTESARCINCHMTGRFYMGNDFRRDHSFRIPRPDQSLQYNTPNACTGCHKDKNNQWAYKEFVKLYGKPKKNHFSDKLATGMTNKPNGEKSLLALARNTAYPDIARASAISNLRNYTSIINPAVLVPFLKDKSPYVKGATADVMADLNLGKTYGHALLPLLKDPKRAVRVKAFFALANFPENKVPEAYLPFYNKVKVEFATHLKATGEFSGGKMKRAQFYIAKGNLSKGIETLENALKYDPINNVVRTNLANLYYQTRQLAKAEQAYKTILKQEPGYGMTNFDYGLLLNELGRKEEALKQLQLAHGYMPENNRIVYNLSLMMFQKGDKQAAITLAQKQQKKQYSADLDELIRYMVAN